MNYPLQDWYQIPHELRRSDWSEPYFDTGGGNALMATLSVPFFAGTGEARRIMGIVTADIALDWLTETVGSIKVLQTGYAFLLSRNGTIVTHPDAERIMNETIFSLAEARGDRVMRELGRRMQRGELGFAPYTTYAGIGSRLYYAPVPSAGWTLAIVFPEAELFSSARHLTLTVAGIGVAGLLLLAGIVSKTARSITKPLSALAEATKEISEGKFNAPFARQHGSGRGGGAEPGLFGNDRCAPRAHRAAGGCHGGQAADRRRAVYRARYPDVDPAEDAAVSGAQGVRPVRGHRPGQGGWRRLLRLLRDRRKPVVPGHRRCLRQRRASRVVHGGDEDAYQGGREIRVRRGRNPHRGERGDRPRQ